MALGVQRQPLLTRFLCIYIRLSLSFYFSAILSASLPLIPLLWEAYVVAVSLMEEICMTHSGVYNEEHWSEQSLSLLLCSLSNRTALTYDLICIINMCECACQSLGVCFTLVNVEPH